VERAIEFEFRRQVEMLEKGEIVVQETRGWDEAKQRTTSQRNKEDSQDYRYMPDADIPPIVLSDEEIERIQSTVPRLPSFYRQSWKVLNLDSTVINALIASQPTAQFVQRILEKSDSPSVTRRIASWQLMAVEGQADDSGIVQNTGIHATDDHLIELSEMVEKNELSSTAAKEIFYEMNRRPDVAPRDIATEKNLIQVSDEAEIIKVVDAILGEPSFSKAVADLKAGNAKVIGFLVGQIMKKSQGKANPTLAQKLIKERLKIK
jgi:aspartyl-tRNA(Asn)/glutamyl-tRNA(Gln) amidotransferase subunit B